MSVDDEIKKVIGMLAVKLETANPGSMKDRYLKMAEKDIEWAESFRRATEHLFPWDSWLLRN